MFYLKRVRSSTKEKTHLRSPAKYKCGRFHTSTVPLPPVPQRGRAKGTQWDLTTGKTGGAGAKGRGPQTPKAAHKLDCSIQHQGFKSNEAFFRSEDEDIPNTRKRFVNRKPPKKAGHNGPIPCPVWLSQASLWMGGQDAETSLMAWKGR